MKPKAVIGLKEWEAYLGTNYQEEAGKKFDRENRIDLRDKKSGKIIILSPFMKTKDIEKVVGTPWYIGVENLQSMSAPEYRFVLYHKRKNDRNPFPATSNYYVIPHTAYCGLGEIKSWATLSGIRKWVKSHISELK